MENAFIGMVAAICCALIVVIPVGLCHRIDDNKRALKHEIMEFIVLWGSNTEVGETLKVMQAHNASIKDMCKFLGINYYAVILGLKPADVGEHANQKEQ